MIPVLEGTQGDVTLEPDTNGDVVLENRNVEFVEPEVIRSEELEDVNHVVRPAERRT